MGCWENILCPVVITVNPGQIAFREQLRLGCQPMLDIVSWQRTLIHIGEIGPPGHFVGRHRKIIFVLVRVRGRNMLWFTGRFLVVGEFIVFHEVWVE